MAESPDYKSPEEIAIMAEGGRKLALVKGEIKRALKPGVSAWDIEVLADKTIASLGAKPSFKRVKGYSWATCVNVNAGIVHGIPKKEIVFSQGDIVSVDVGVYFKGFHTDTSLTVLMGEDKKKARFLKTGEEALERAIEKARVGNRIRDISWEMENTIKQAGYSPIHALVGHGVGRRLHEYPPVPCFISGAVEEGMLISEGLVIAIEVMYASGSNSLTTLEDGWTIATKDGKISALFEETVAVTSAGPRVLTK